MSDPTHIPAPELPPPAPGAPWDGPPDGGIELDWRWLDRPGNVRRLRRGGAVALALLALVDLIQHFATGEHHALVFWQAWPLGYALYGGLGCAAIILACKMWFGPLLKRKEGYYD